MLLYQLCIKLLGCGDPDRVIQIALDLLQKRTKAAVVGFLSVDDEGNCGPKLVIPAGCRRSRDAQQKLTELVSRQGHAVWVANQATGDRGQETGWQARRSWSTLPTPCAPRWCGVSADGERPTLGAIHVYLRRPLPPIGFRLHHLRGQHRGDRAGPRAASCTTSAERLPAAGREVARLRRADRRERADARAEVEDQTRRQAPGCVLVRGESGSGKELVARAIHRASPRADRPMVSVNCAAIPADLMESQLFGHKAGSFTGADRDHMRLLSAGRPGHAVPRRSRRADARRPGQAAADSRRAPVPCRSARRRK